MSRRTEKRKSGTKKAATKAKTKKTSSRAARGREPSVLAVQHQRLLLERRVARDRKDRYADYLRALRPAGGKGMALLAAAPKPHVLAEGDSWFEYPIPGSGFGVIYQLHQITGVPILNMAHHGDEVRYMLGVKQRREIEQRLADPLRFDALLFSGGGNDLIGDPFVMWLRDYDPNLPAEGHLIAERVNDALGLVEAGYRELIAIRDRVSRSTKIFVHGYDYPRPSNKGVCGVGPWLKPSLDYRGIVVPDAQARIAKALLVGFREVLRRLEAGTPDFHYVETQGLLDPAHDWANEIHPTKDGFRKVAKQFRKALAPHFPAFAGA
jgi:hypothetical protein